MQTAADLIPKWTKRVVTETTGRDPLGLSRVSFIITDYILTGIITTTDRARYYSFYCWALWHTTLEDDLKKYQDFVTGFRRREAVLALATIENNSETSPVGVVAATSQLEKGKSNSEYNCDFRVLPANQLGGYGQYYSGSLYQLGLTHRLEDGIDRPSEGAAVELAQSFHSSIKNTPYIKNKLFHDNQIKQQHLNETKKYITLDALHEKFADGERRKLIDLFFGFNKDIDDERAFLRKHTLSLILFTILEYQNIDVKVNRSDLDWFIVYPTYYFNELRIRDSSTKPFTPPQSFRYCFLLWKQFCVHQLLTQALENLMHSVLEAVGSSSSGLKLDELIRTILGSVFFTLLKDVTGSECKTPAELMDQYGLKQIPTEELCLEKQVQISLFNPKSEAELIKAENKTPAESAAVSIMILATLYAKWRSISKNSGFAYVGSNVGSEIWIGSIFNELDTWHKDSTTWAETLKNIITDMTLNQHDRIMYEKRRLDSCWLRRVEGRIIKDQDYGPRWRSSRHGNAVSILCDLKLLDSDKDQNISITKEGQNILEKIISEEERVK